MTPFRDPSAVLAYEMKRNPWLKAIYENIDAYSIDQLNALPFPMKWMREAMVSICRERLALAKQLEAVSRLEASTSALPDSSGQLILWQGDEEAFFRIDTGGQIGVRYGHYLFMPNSGGIYLDTLFSRSIDPIVYQGGLVCGETTLTKYKTLVAAERDKRCPSDAPIIDLTGQDAAQPGRSPTSNIGRLAGMGVRFS